MDSLNRATAHTELETTLNELLCNGTPGAEMYSLLYDMLGVDALQIRTEVINGVPTTVWFAACANEFADRIFPMEDDDSALKAELFLLGNIVFTVGKSPVPHLWWRSAICFGQARSCKPN